MNGPTVTLPSWALVAIGVSVVLNLVGIGYLAGRAAGSTPETAEIEAFAAPIVAGTHTSSLTSTLTGTITDHGEGPDGEARTITISGPNGPTQVVRIRTPQPIVSTRASRVTSGAGMDWVAHAVPAERQHTIAFEMSRAVDPLIEDAGALRALRSEVRAALENEPFAPERLEAVLEELRRTLAEVQRKSHRVLIDTAARLDAAERAALAANFTPYVQPGNGGVHYRFVGDPRWANPQGDEGFGVQGDVEVEVDTDVDPRQDRGIHERPDDR